MTVEEIAAGLSEKAKAATARIAHLGPGADGWDTVEIGATGATMMALHKRGLVSLRVDRVFRRCLYSPTDLGRSVAAALKEMGNG